MKIVPTRNRIIALLGSAALFALAPQLAFALDSDMKNAVAHGKSLFMNEHFGGNGRVCNTCHVDGGKAKGKLPNGQPLPSLRNAAAIFPQFRGQAHKLTTLPDQIRHCIQGGLQGTPPEYGSEDLNSLVSYVTSLSQGKKINMGGKPR